MVKITSFFTVCPAEPTPNEVISLSICDQIKLKTHFPLIFVYPNSDPSSFGILRESLSSVLVYYYPLAGRLRCPYDDQLQLECNGLGVQLLRAESGKRLEDYGDFAPTDNIKELVPQPSYARQIQELPLLIAQYTRFACKGHTIGISISRVVVDGASTFAFIRSWARIARGHGLDLLPIHDRTLLQPSNPLTLPRFDHEEFKPMPVLIKSQNVEAEIVKTTSVALLKLSEVQVEALKRKANCDARQILHRPYSKFEVITAHVWRCVCKARSSDPNQPTKLRFLIDCRKRVDPPLPQGYFGNARFATVTSICCLKELLTEPFSYMANKIREVNERFTNEYVRSLIDTVASRQQQNTHSRVKIPVAGSMEDIFIGNPNISVTSWINLSTHEADFGWGKPISIGPAELASDGKCFILPGGVGDGSILVAICLQEAHMEAFKALFYKDIIENGFHQIPRI